MYKYIKALIEVIAVVIYAKIWRMFYREHFSINQIHYRLPAKFIWPLQSVTPAFSIQHIIKLVTKHFASSNAVQLQNIRKAQFSRSQILWLFKNLQRRF